VLRDDWDVDSLEFFDAGPHGQLERSAVGWPQAERLAQLCDVARRVYFDSARTFRWRRRDGSWAAHYEEVLPSEFRRVPPLRRSGFEIVEGVIQAYLLAAAGRLGGMAAAFSTGEVLFAPAVLARSSIECSARALWVLGVDSEPPENALARAYLEELLSVEEQRKTYARLRGKDSDAYQEAQRDHRALREQAVQVFNGTTMAELNEGALGGQRRARIGEAVTWAYELTAAGTSAQAATRAALGIYDYLSNRVHPTLYPIRFMMDNGVDDSRLGFTLWSDYDSLTKMAAAPVLEFYGAMDLITSFYGWDRRLVDELGAEIEGVVPGMLV
jgi:hypothetical protein